MMMRHCVLFISSVAGRGCLSSLHLLTHHSSHNNPKISISMLATLKVGAARPAFRSRSFVRSVRVSIQRAKQFSTENKVPEKAPSKIRQLWDDGTILLSLGFSSLFLVAVDRFLQYQNKQEVTETVQDIRQQVEEKRREMMERYQDSPTLFQCKVVEEYKMGGSHGLKGVKVGDVVDILQEDVGPGEYYHLCRTRDAETADVLSIGWYPQGYMEPIQGEKKRRWMFWKSS